jgi:hypothetical protein
VLPACGHLHTVTLVSAYASVCPPHRYFDPVTVGLDFDGMMQDLKAAPDGSVILLHGGPLRCVCLSVTSCLRQLECVLLFCFLETKVFLVRS